MKDHHARLEIARLLRTGGFAADIGIAISKHSLGALWTRPKALLITKVDDLRQIIVKRWTKIKLQFVLGCELEARGKGSPQFASKPIDRTELLVLNQLLCLMNFKGAAARNLGK